MLCRCFPLPSVQAKTGAPAEPRPVVSASAPLEKFMNTLSVPPALTSFGVRGVISGSRLFWLKTTVYASCFHVSRAGRLHLASNQGRCSTEGATPAHSTTSSAQHARLCPSRKPGFRPSTLIHHSTVRRAEPNPSFKPSPNGGSRWPSSAGPTAHFALAVQRAPPSVPA